MADAAAKGSRKRKAEGPKFYAVRAGHTIGVKHTWDDCKASITGFKGAVYKSFPTVKDAEDFVAGKAVASADSKSTKFYGVAVGKKTGVYTDWTEAEAQIKGQKNPKYRKFATRAEAEAFVASGAESSQAPAADEDSEDSEARMDENEPPRKRVRRDDEEADNGSAPDSDVVTAAVVQPKGRAEKKGAPLRIYTDGSSLGNGKVGASAGVGVYFGPGDPRNLSEALEGNPQTNQRAELTALLRALEIAPVDREVEIFTDSNYSINCVTVWFQSWEKKGWQTSQNKPVMNKDLVQLILEKIRERQAAKTKTTFNWIKGHSNDPGNEAADRLAVAGAQRIRG